MFAIERLNKIKELLYQEKRVDVFELSELFSVTEATIRRIWTSWSKLAS